MKDTTEILKWKLVRTIHFLGQHSYPLPRLYKEILAPWPLKRHDYTREDEAQVLSDIAEWTSDYLEGNILESVIWPAEIESDQPYTAVLRDLLYNKPEELAVYLNNGWQIEVEPA